MARLPLPKVANFINNEFRSPIEMEGRELHDPFTAETLGPMPNSEISQVEEALDAAQTVYDQGHWERMPGIERAAYLDAVADRLELQQSNLSKVEAMTTGVVHQQTDFFTGLLPSIFRRAAVQCRSDVKKLPGKFGPVEIWRKPWGPALCLTPWNSPSVISAHKVASALGAGCPVIFKPSEYTPFCAQFLAEAIVEADLPPGLFQMVHGGREVGSRLVDDTRIGAISFTGGTAGGIDIAQKASQSLKPVQLELGGNNPCIVLEGADLDHAAGEILKGLTTLNGQWCRAIGRILVAAPLHDALIEKVTQKLANVVIGDPLDETSAMGPMISQTHLAHLNERINVLRGEGASTWSKTPLPSTPGYFLSPTLISDVEPQQVKEEIFGPVCSVQTFTSPEEAVTMANDSCYGLAAYVFGLEQEALELSRSLRTGSTKVGGIGALSLHPAAPRSAWGLSGIGEEGDLESFAFFSGARVVGIAGKC